MIDDAARAQEHGPSIVCDEDHQLALFAKYFETTIRQFSIHAYELCVFWHGETLYHILKL